VDVPGDIERLEKIIAGWRKVNVQDTEKFWAGELGDAYL
jgi:hypothetical protein